MAAGNRIKYIDHKFKNNSKISTKSFTSKRTGAKYRTVLNLDDMQYYIRNERTKEYIFKSKSYNSLNVLKRNARAKLESLGVELKREVRDRTFGICEKNYNQQKHEQLQEKKKNEGELNE